MKRILPLVLMVCCLCSMTHLFSQIPAFPGAEGFGRFTEGGRGGDVYHVTNLNDSGEGSLRLGVESADGPRTIVFEVSGNIELKSHLTVRESYMTIAGQTAPGDGICVKDYGFKISGCHDVIVRYIRFRLGDEHKTAPAGYDAIETNDVSNIIFDHLSASWGIDGTHDLRGEKFTLQWSIYGEALNNSLHEKGAHAMLGSMRDLTDNITLHHNLMHSSRNRHPTLGGGSKTRAETIVDFRNNVVFNWDGPTNLGDCKHSLINNYYKPGASTSLSERPMQVKAPEAWEAMGYSNGNVFPWNSAWTNDNYQAIQYTNSGNYGSTTREAFELPGEIVFGDDVPGTHSAEEAYDLVLQYAGASKSRDSADARIVRGIKDGTNRLIDSQSEVGGFPVLNSLPAPADNDRDGMADDWESENGLNPADPEDRNGDRNQDGYTNLEEYLYSLVPLFTDVAPVVKVLSPVSDTGYLQIDTVFVKAIAVDYGGGTIESMELYLDAELISTAAGTTIDTFLTGLTTGPHHIIAKATDNGGQVRLDSSKIYVGTKYCTITIDSIVGGGTVIMDPPGGTYMETMEVSLQAIPSFLFNFGNWSGDVTGTDEQVMLTMTDDLSLTANFVFDTSSVVNINFQPGTSPVPMGYMADIGDEYGLREGGYVYGWLGAYNPETRDRGGMEDTRKATLNHMQKSGNAIWEFELPEGSYAVNIHMGDNDYDNQVNSIDVEGIEITDPETDSANFDEYLVEDVYVIDGRLTITPLDNAKINYIKIGLKESAFGRFLIVGEGTGTGEHAIGETVEIVASDPEEHYEFREWVGGSSDISDVTAPQTSLIMPDHDLSVHAEYDHLIFSLSVINGTGSGEYYPGDLVFLVANAPPEGQVFSEWVPENNEVVDIVNVNAASTWLAIPAYNVKVTATFEDAVSTRSLQDASGPRLNCYPNPSGGAFFVDLSTMGNSDIVVTDMLGQQLYHTIAKGIHSIDDPAFTAGIYFIRVTDQQGEVYLQKIIIK